MLAPTRKHGRRGVQGSARNSKPFAPPSNFVALLSAAALSRPKSKSKASRLTALMICLKRLWPSLRTIRLRGWRQPIVCYLTEQHRQDDPGFFSVNPIRRNEFTDAHLAHLKNAQCCPGMCLQPRLNLFTQRRC